MLKYSDILRIFAVGGYLSNALDDNQPLLL